MVGRASRGGRVTPNEVAAIVVDAAIEVHRTLGGPGLLESVYEEALVFELEDRGLQVERQKEVRIIYKGKCLANVLRVDLLVGGKLVVECKATVQDNPIYDAQGTAARPWSTAGWRSGASPAPITAGCMTARETS